MLEIPATARQPGGAALRGAMTALRLPDPAPSRLVLHLGGPRHGHVVRVPVEELAGHLVYSGPRWFGVYRCVQPVRTRLTALGDAEVWVVDE